MIGCAIGAALMLLAYWLFGTPPCRWGRLGAERPCRDPNCLGCALITIQRIHDAGEKP